MKIKNKFSVSTIIPVYNAERYLERAVLSAIAEPEVREVILVEDASPDGARAVCEELAKTYPDKIKLIYHPDGCNHGAGPSRNLGVSHAKAPFIAFLDADDYYLPGRFQRDATAFAADESLDGVYSLLGADILDEAGRQWWLERGHRHNTTTVSGAPPPEKLFFQLSPIGRKGHFHINTLTIRKEIFDTLRFSDLRLSQDTLFFFQLAALFKIKSVTSEEPVAMRGVHGENRIRDLAQMRLAERQVWQTLGKWAAETRLPHQKLKAISRTQILMALDWREICDIYRHDPALIVSYSAWILLARWFLLRRYPGDPPVPGLFPKWRRKHPF